MPSLESLRNFRQGWHKVSIELIPLPNASSCAWYTGNPKNTAASESEAEKGLLQGQARRWMAHAPQNPKLPEGFQQSTFFFPQQSTFKGQVREERGWLLQTPWCRNPLFLTAVHRGQVMMFLQTSNKINDI